MARKTLEESARTRRNIVDAAALAFARAGVANVTLEHIAQSAGVTRGAIYWHFKGKDELLQSILDEQALPLERVFPMQRELATNWQHLCDGLIETIGGGAATGLYEILWHTSELTDDNGPISQRLQQARARFSERLQALLDAAVVSGELAADLDVQAVNTLFRHCIAGLMFESFKDGNEEATAKVPATLDTLWYLLHNPPPHFLRNC